MCDRLALEIFMAIELLPLMLLTTCGLSLAGFDLFRKALSRHLAPVPMVFLLATASVPLFAAMFFFEGRVAVCRGYFPPAVASVALNLAAHLAFIQAIRIAPLSVTVPLLSLTPAFTALLGMLVLGEEPTAQSALGIGLVVVGAFWLSSPSEGEGNARRVSGWRLVARPGAWLVALTALFWSMTLPLDKLAVARSSAGFHGLFLTAGIACGAFFVLLRTRRLGEMAGLRQARGLFILTLLASTLTLAAQLLSLKLVLVSIVEAVKRGVGNILAVVLGRLAFGESLTVRKLSAAATMALGVALILS